MVYAAMAMSAADLLIFLLDLIASAPGRQWPPLALAFLNAYDNAPVIVQLSRQLTPPSGMAWIWWGVANQFRQPGENKTTSNETSGPDFPPWALPHSRCYARPPETAGLNHLPANERRNSQTNFSRAPNQGKGECAVTRNAK